MAADAAVPRERTSRFDSISGRRKSSSSAKAAHYLSSDSGRARKSAYHQMDAHVGFSVAPASAKLYSSAQLVGEGLVSRTWRFQGSRPVVVDGILYDTTGDRLEASDARTGRLVWSWQDAEATEGERLITPPAVAHGRVWAGTWDGRIISWDALTGRVRWAVKVGDPCHWQPVVSDGWLYAGLENGTLIGFATGDLLDTDWPMWGGGCGHNGRPIPRGRTKPDQPADPSPPERKDIEKLADREPAGVP
jgi:hypothetical protein